MRRAFMYTGALLLGVACHSGAKPGVVEADSAPAPPSAKAACYRLEYADARAATHLPRVIALDPGGSSGRAFWYPSGRTDSEWRSFSHDGRWKRNGGRVSVKYRARAARVELDLERQAGATVAGQATRSEGSSAGDATSVRGSHVICPAAPRGT
ncbi:MAG: hypothetical protein H0U85_08635 [Gemmatimonadales bacterium]|nr:hypothetical protein [Gemmatimonadales bacterium]